MKIGIVGDVHWSRYSSIVRQRGQKYSYRLENCIDSINWAEQVTAECDIVVYLGDFFDAPELNAEEITALKELQWNRVQHYFLVGNHEMGINDLSYSSSHLFDYIDIEAGAEVIDKPRSLQGSRFDLHFIPYILETDRKPLKEYLNKREGNITIVFSHNDIAGIQLGAFTSINGFSIQEIQENSDWYFNGHLHNGSKIAGGVLNVGNLTGQNFSEDAFSYDHGICILNTDDMKCAFYENPFAMNFYKINSEDYEEMPVLKQNAVVTIRVPENKQDEYRKYIENNLDIIASRMILIPSEHETSVENSHEVFSVNHLSKFSTYILEVLGNTDVVRRELEEVLK